MFNIGPLELMLILLIALVVVGPARLPEVGRSIGKGLREFRKVQDEVRDSINFNLDEPIRPPSPRTPPVRTPQPPAPTPEDDDPGPAPAPAAGPENEAAAIASEETPATTEVSPAGAEASADSVDPARPAAGSANGSTPAPETPRE
jgi:TatA/E family protein of Tat protein translocase